MIITLTCIVLLSSSVSSMFFAQDETSSQSMGDRSAVDQKDRRLEALKRLQEDGLGERTDSTVLWRALLDRTTALMESNRELAKSNLALAGLEDELDDLRQFIVDHDTYGQDFTAYTKVVEETRRQARASVVRERRAREEAKRQKQQEARRKLDESRKKSNLEKIYDEKGFASIGQDVYTSRSAFFYAPYEGEDGSETASSVASSFSTLVCLIMKLSSRRSAPGALTSVIVHGEAAWALNVEPSIAMRGAPEWPGVAPE